MRLRLLALVVGAVALTAGCADSTADPDGFGGTVTAVTITYEGNPLYCVQYGMGHGSVDCDWVRYHNENPR